MPRLVSVCVLLLVIANPRPVDAWGFAAHRYIMSMAIPRLPPQLRPFFEANRAEIVEHAIDPDLWRTAGWEVEDKRHFVDLDAYGPYPFADLPHDEADAVAKFTRAFVDKNGTLPWRTQEMYGKLVEAFTQKAGYSRENIKFFSSVVAHYVGDAHVPFHAALNYDGQLTQQWGVHARFESELFERYRPRLIVKPGAPVPVPSAREMIFGTLTESYSFVQPILDADRLAVAGREVYDDGYYTMFFAKARPILERRLADSVRDVVSVITAAWVEAGRPAVPLSVKRTPRTVRRQ
ncbi:MAG: hypothetical protein ABIX28_24980 [Vicinamibacterales bacterium]